MFIKIKQIFAKFFKKRPRFVGFCYGGRLDGDVVVLDDYRGEEFVVVPMEREIVLFGLWETRQRVEYVYRVREWRGERLELVFEESRCSE